MAHASGAAEGELEARIVTVKKVATPARPCGMIDTRTSIDPMSTSRQRMHEEGSGRLVDSKVDPTGNSHLDEAGALSGAVERRETHPQRQRCTTRVQRQSDRERQIDSIAPAQQH